MHGKYMFAGHLKEVYGKLEYFLEQLQFSPVEFIFHTQGTGKLVEKIQEVFGSEINIHPEWREIVNSLNLEVRGEHEHSINTGIWARFFNDIPVIAGIGSRSVEPMLHQLKRYISEPQTPKEKLCGRTPLNLVKVNNWAPNEVMIPSDLGLPIVMNFNIPSVWKVGGDVHVECSGRTPSVSLTLETKLASSMTGYVETICPFTKEIVATGISKQTTINYPVKVTTEVEQGSLKVKFSEPQSLKRTSQPVDILVNTIKPFTVVKPVSILDGVSVVAHQNTKTIHSHSQMKTMNHRALQTFGLDVEFVTKTEQEIVDMKSVIDHLALYKYNPLNMALFGWTNTAVTKSGRPSIRNHVMKIVYNPSRSSTKEIEAEIELSVGYMRQNQSPKAISLASIQQQSQVKQLIQNLDIASGLGLTGKFFVKLVGGSPKTYNFVVSAGHGQKGMEQKWKLHLENSEVLSICVDGSARLPLIPLREIKNLRFDDVSVSFRNTIGFGRSCSEHSIKVSGTTSVSQQQQQRAQRSESSRQLEQLKEKVHQLTRELENTRVGSVEYKQIQQRLLEVVEQKNEQSRQQLLQYSTLDQARFTVEYTPMPEYVKMWAKMVDTGVKGVLIPYMTEYQSRGPRGEVKVDLQFHPHMNSLSLVLATEESTVRYNNIRLPEQVKEFLPATASYFPNQHIVSLIQGASVYPKCTVGDHVVQTFGNKSYTYALDDCYHVLTAETSQHKTYSVLAKEVQGKKFVKSFVLGSKIVLKPTQHQSEIEVEVDGQIVRLNRNERKQVESQNKKVTYTLHRTSDEFVVVETPYMRIITNGHIVEVENTHMIPVGKLHGLCGAGNGYRREDIVNAQSCIAQSIQAAALSFRVKDQSCSSLSSHQQQLQQQKVICDKKLTEKTPISKIVQQQLKKCSQMKHAMMKQTGRLCISQIPIVECGSGCAPKSLVRKSIPFTCIPSDRKRVVQLYEEKVMRGDILPELRNMDKTFSSEMHVPVSCSHPGL